METAGLISGIASANLLAEKDAKSALGRGSDPEEQAQLAAFLASDRDFYISGAIIIYSARGLDAAIGHSSAMISKGNASAENWRIQWPVTQSLRGGLPAG